MMNPCGGKAHSYVRIIEAELECPMDYVKNDLGGCEITETVNEDGSVVIETSRDGYIKRYTFSKN